MGSVDEEVVGHTCCVHEQNVKPSTPMHLPIMHDTLICSTRTMPKPKLIPNTKDQPMLINY